MGVKLDICKRCGHVPVGYFITCPFCNIPSTEYDIGYSQKEFEDLEWDEKVKLRQHIFEDVIKKSPEFSQDAMDFRIKRQDELYKESIKKHARSGPRIRCPYCNSTNTRKATPGSYVSHGFFGIFSKSFGKQWHCNSCGSDF
ncbi:hypothetical protein [Murimonas intestini]|uniref:hypothetical protein n=1 Tax=Murimonas intestini TaxID=1337051 RepID=UPI0011DCF346|nr:hypothetical protein [Murimonas intestini]